jgi:hypothetical protein
MKAPFFVLVIIVSAFSGFCQSTPVDTKRTDDEIILIDKKENKKYGLEAQFYGVNIKYGENSESSAKIIRSIVFKDLKNGSETKYESSSTTAQAANFYFTDVWSPDDEYLILPLGKFEGFAILESKDALNNIKLNKYFDTIRISSANSKRFYWHDFEKWEDNSTLNFRAGLEGDMFAFKYNFEKKALACYQEKCEEFDIGFNNKGKIKPIKKGIVEPLQVH